MGVKAGPLAGCVGVGTVVPAKGSGASPSRMGDWTVEALVDIGVVDDKNAS